MIDFFAFWVGEFWGSMWLALIGTGLMFAVIGVLGRMSYLLLTTLLVLYFIVFGVGFFGIIVYLPLILLSGIYFVFQLYKLFMRE